MSNKNPFEIRSDILAMAKDYMDKQQEINMELAKRAYDVALETGKATAETWKQYVPAQYSIEELTKKAQELYVFVSKKD